ncbi:MAG: DUF2111 domain-containing protein [Candidatus Methanofastidiosia archaeon]
MIYITKNSKGSEICHFAVAVHELSGGLPITMRTKNQKGVRIEKGKVVNMHYTGPVLEKVLEKGETMRMTPSRGIYKGIPVCVVPIKNEKGETIAALGVVDITMGIFEDLMLITSRPEIQKLKEKNMV